MYTKVVWVKIRRFIYSKYFIQVVNLELTKNCDFRIFFSYLPNKFPKRKQPSKRFNSLSRVLIITGWMILKAQHSALRVRFLKL